MIKEGEKVSSRLDELIAEENEANEKILSVDEIDALLGRLPDDMPKNELADEFEKVFRSLASCNEFIREEYLEKIKKKYKIRIALLRELVQRHVPRRPRFKGEVNEEGNQYIYYSADGSPVSISNFIIKPTEILKVEVRMMLKGDLIDSAGRSRSITFSETAWHSRKDFLKSLSSYNCVWTGTDDHVQGLRRLLAADEGAVHKEGTYSVGYVDTDRGARWVSPDMVISAGGINQVDDIVFVAKSASSSFARRLGYRSARLEDVKMLAAQVLPKLLDLNVGTVVIPMIGWFFGAFFKPLIMKETGAFPILFVWGTKGAGKTSLVKLFWKLVGVVKTLPFSVTNTAFPLYDAFDATTSIPIMLDEYKPRDMGKQRVDQIHRMLRRLYDGDVEQRGKPDLSVAQYKLSAPVVVAGESRPEGDAALIERLLAVSPNRQHLDATSTYKQTFQLLQRLPIEDLDVPFIEFAMRRDFKSDFACAQKTAAQLIGAVPNGGAVPTRNVNNLTTMVFGVQMFEEFAASLGVNLPKPDLASAVSAPVASVLDGDRGSKDAFDEFLEALSVYARHDKLVQSINYDYLNGRLLLHLESCHEVYLAERKRTGRDDDTNGLPALRRLIKEKIERGGYIKDNSHRLKAADGQTRRWIQIAVDEVPENLAFDPFPKNFERVHGGRRDNFPSEPSLTGTLEISTGEEPNLEN